MKRKTANQNLANYILLRDAIEDNIDPSFTYVRCRTCGRMLQRISKKSHAGHFVPKGMGGGSGVYYDERNVHTQCSTCNDTLEGNRTEYWPFMLKEYDGQEVIDELRRKHHLPRPHSIDEYGTMYREKFKELKKKYGLSR